VLLLSRQVCGASLDLEFFSMGRTVRSVWVISSSLCQGKDLGIKHSAFPSLAAVETRTVRREEERAPF